MRAVALIFVLSLAVPLNLLGQHHSESGSSSGSSSGVSHSSSSGGGSSSSHSSGYSGGSSSGHSSGSGGSSNHSSGSSGGSSHASSRHGSSGDSSGSRSRSGNASDRSFATGNTKNAAGLNRMGAAANSRNLISSAALPKEDFGLLGPGGWMSAPIVLHHVNGDVNKALQRGDFDADLHPLGLESSEKAYLAKLAAQGETDKSIPEKKPSWLARTFHVQPDRRPPVGPPKPCKGKNCQPAPPPKPSPPPARPPVVRTAGCYGYIQHCEVYGICYAHLRPVSYSHCDEIRRQLSEQEEKAKRLEQQADAACGAASQSAECISASADFQQTQANVAQLRAQYKICISAANFSMRSGVSDSPAGPAVVPLGFAGATN